jgi:hypothetical protein
MSRDVTWRGSPEGSRNARVAQFNGPTGLARSWDYPNFTSVMKRSVSIADTGNHTIRRFGFSLGIEACPTSNDVFTLAGTAGSAGSQDGRGAAARFNTPRGLAAARDGSVYVIRRLTPAQNRRRAVHR